MKTSRSYFLLLAALTLPGCPGRRVDGPRSFPGTPVVVVCVDTLRSDHLPFYGYAGVETPALSALRADAILFEKAYSHVPLTLPAHASIFTGTLPGTHGVLDNAGYRLAAGTPTFAELLKKEGYATGAAVSSIVLQGSSGISRGFDLWDDAIEPDRADLPMNRVQRPGARSAAILNAWIETKKNVSFLAFLHVYEPHSPYEAPEPFRSRYAQPYDGEIAASDAVVGELTAKLKALGLYEKSLIVFLSDHGEGLGEHGENEHGVFLYRESLQVPLLVKLPANALGGKSIATPVQISDVFRTVVEAVGTKTKGASAHPGLANLVDLAYGNAAPERRIYAETFYPRIRFGWSDLAALLDQKWHYVDAPKPEFFDVEKDPGGTKNLAEEKPGPYRSFVVEVRKRRAPFQAPSAVESEHAKKLASLGYLSMTTSGSSGALADPKDEIGSLTRLKEGLGYLQTGRPAEAAATLQELLDRNPRVIDAWELLGQALVQLGRPGEALAAMKKTVELSPAGKTNYILAVANLCLQIGRPDEALVQAKAAREMGDPNSDEVIARAELARGNLTAAEEAAKRALTSGRMPKGALLVLARIQGLRGDFSGALARTDEIQTAAGGSEELAGLPGFHYLRGDLFARMNRSAEAEREFLAEIRVYPQGLEARVGLAVTYAATGRRPEAIRVVSEMVRDLPRPDAYATGIRTLQVLQEPAAAARLRSEGLARFLGEPRLQGGR